jgi:hypothetical protein
MGSENVAPFDDDGFSERDRRALATLEVSLKANGPRRWPLASLRVLAWRSSAVMLAGVIVSLTGLAVMCVELSSAVWVAVGGEGAFVLGALSFACAIRRWWYGRYLRRGPFDQ